MSSSLIKLFSGRKQTSGVWQYFEYDNEKNKSKCLVNLEGNGNGISNSSKICSFPISGKNPTNLKKHLASQHKATWEALTKLENEASTSSNVNIVSSTSCKRKLNESCPIRSQQTLQYCLQKRIDTYPKDSYEHKTREGALLQMIIDTGSAMNLLEHPSFVAYSRAMDAKFSVPG